MSEYFFHTQLESKDAYTFEVEILTLNNKTKHAQILISSHLDDYRNQMF